MLTTTVLASLGLQVGTVAAETVLGAVVFTRHGDRKPPNSFHRPSLTSPGTTKHYGNQQLTSLGARQNFQIGSDYRARYIDANATHRIRGISDAAYDPSQIYATAPNQPILLSTATSFLQGLYPPLADVDPAIATSTLANGTDITAPLSGYQYVPLSSIPTNSPSTIWLKGDDLCPAYTTSSKSYASSPEYQTVLDSTRPFYQSLSSILASFYPDSSSLSFQNAYDIFDLLNVARIHNASTSAVTDDTLYQLRTLADTAEFNFNYNPSEPARSIGGATLAGAVLNQLNKTVTSKGKLKFSLLAGSYDTFLAFFGLAGLIKESEEFYGLPEYASTMAWEVFSEGETEEFPEAGELKVRFLFRNGTEGALNTWSLFGRGREVLGWGEFVEGMRERAVASVEEWCGICQSQVDFCGVYDVKGTEGRKGLSNVVAGVIGAVVTLGVMFLVTVGFLILRKMSRKAARPTQGGEEKFSLHSGSRV